MMNVVMLSVVMPYSCSPSWGLLKCSP